MMLGDARILALVAAACAAGAAALVLTYLVRRPSFDRGTQLRLLLAIGPLSLVAALATNAVNRDVMRERRFCGGCHAMDPFASDAANAASQTLVARHSKNPWLGTRSCSSCHADYAMLHGGPIAAAPVARLVEQYTDEWGPGHRRPHVQVPFSNEACLACHAQVLVRAPVEHRLHGAAIGPSGISCVSGGCHGPAHVASARTHAWRIEPPP